MITVFLGLGTHPAKGLPIFLTEEVNFLSVHHTQLPVWALLGTLADFSKVVHHVGYLSIGPEILEQEVAPAHRTDATPLLFPPFPLLLPSPQDLPSTTEEEHHPNGLSRTLDNDVGGGHVFYLPGSHGGAYEH